MTLLAPIDDPAEFRCCLLDALEALTDLRFDDTAELGVKVARYPDYGHVSEGLAFVEWWMELTIPLLIDRLEKKSLQRRELGRDLRGRPTSR